MTIVDITATLDGEGSQTTEGSATYAADLAMLAGSSDLTAGAGILFSVTASLAGASVFSATSDSDLSVILAVLGNSALMVDPTKVTVTNFSRGPQVPSTARPPTIPTIRIVPPSPPQASYSVTPASNRNRRREER